MLTEKQIRDIYNKYFPNADLLTSDPITPETCILPYYTEEELEAQCQRIANPNFENYEAYCSADSQVFQRAISSGRFQMSFTEIPYEESIEYRLEQERLTLDTSKSN